MELEPGVHESRYHQQGVGKFLVRAFVDMVFQYFIHFHSAFCDDIRFGIPRPQWKVDRHPQKIQLPHLRPCCAQISQWSSHMSRPPWWRPPCRPLLLPAPHNLSPVGSAQFAAMGEGNSQVTHMQRLRVLLICCCVNSPWIGELHPIGIMRDDSMTVVDHVFTVGRDGRLTSDNMHLGICT